MSKSKDLKDRMVPCLRTGKGAEAGNKPIEVGQSFAFASGAAYTFQENGSYRRVGKDRKLSKSERKRLKRERTLARVNPAAT